MMMIHTLNSAYPSYNNAYTGATPPTNTPAAASYPYAPRQSSGLGNETVATNPSPEKSTGRTRDSHPSLPSPPPEGNVKPIGRTRDEQAKNAPLPVPAAPEDASSAVPSPSAPTPPSTTPSTVVPPGQANVTPPATGVASPNTGINVQPPGQANVTPPATGVASPNTGINVQPPGQANVNAAPATPSASYPTATQQQGPVPVVNPNAYVPWVNPAYQQVTAGYPTQTTTTPSLSYPTTTPQRSGTATQQATPQQPEGSGLAPLTVQETDEKGAPISKAKQNKQLSEAIMQAATQVGAPPEDVEKIKYRLSQGNFEVAHADVSKALNITQAEQSDIETKNRLLQAAYNEIQSSLTKEEAQQKLAGLAGRGEVADFVADEADEYGNLTGKGTFISYNTDQTPVKGEPGISRYQVAQRQTRFDDKGEAVSRLRPVDSKTVDALGEWLYVNPTRFRGTPTLSGDAKLKEALNTTLQTPEFATAFNRAVEEADTASAAPTMVSASLQPMLDQIVKTYGIQPVGIQLSSGSPDGGVSNAWYDEKNRAIKISTDTLQQLNQHGTNKGLSGDKLNRFVITELVATLAHEAKHARDYDAINNPEAFGIKSEDDKTALNAIATNRQYYNGPATTRVLTGEQGRYDAQPVERSVAPFEEQALATLYQVNGLDMTTLRG
jgi:hypothetical protein